MTGEDSGRQTTGPTAESSQVCVLPTSLPSATDKEPPWCPQEEGQRPAGGAGGAVGITWMGILLQGEQWPGSIPRATLALAQWV